MRRLLSIAAVLTFTLALAAGAASAAARAGDKAIYQGDDSAGVLTLVSVPDAPFVVLGEQADGTYAQIATGSLPDSGSVTVAVSAAGSHTNGVAQFIVRYYANGYWSCVLARADGASDWYWD